VGDLLYGQSGAAQATADLIYANFLWKPDDYYNEQFYEVYVYAGTNIGVTKRVTDWDLSEFLLTAHSVYAAKCDATSYVELHRIFTVDELNKAINLAIESLSLDYLVDKTDTTSVKLTSTTDNLGNTVYTYEYTLPTDVYYVHRVTTEDTTSGVKLTGTVSGAFTAGETVTGGTSGATGELSYGPAASTYIRLRKVSGTFVVGETATGTSTETCSAITAVASETAGTGKWEESGIIDPRDWGLISSRKLKLNDSYYSVDEDLYLRIEGHGRQAILSADTGICYMPPDWIVQKAITFLPFAKIQSNDLEGVYRNAMASSAIKPRYLPRPDARKVIE